MTNTLSNQPRVARGAFVEYTIGLPPPLVVRFQFNPVQLQRSRSLSFSVPGGAAAPPAGNAVQHNPAAQRNLGALPGGGLRKLHQDKRYTDLFALHKAQQVEVQEESINLEIRFDATDGIDKGDPIATEFGIAPQLAILEQMVYPRSETHLAETLKQASTANKDFSYSMGDKPPLILFAWGERWSLPVNINNINITESEFNMALYPLRATVTVALTVIEGPNAAYKYSLNAREDLVTKGMSKVINVSDIVIPR